MDDVTPSVAALKQKARGFPPGPGVYLMKDAKGRVLYVGKAKNLRDRAGSYFTAVAARDRRTRDLVHEIADLDYVETDNEVDALLMEARLIKDIQPQFNTELKDDKSFPYLEITVRDHFPGVYFTREPRARGTKLYGPFPSAYGLRAAIQALQRVFKFRTCSLDIRDDDPKWRYFRPCLLHHIGQCYAPCNNRISRADYARSIARLRMCLDGRRDRLLDRMRAEMAAASRELAFERAARIRDQIAALEQLSRRGDLGKHVQPEVFYVDPKKGLTGLRKVLGLDHTPRSIEGVDIAHLGGKEAVGSLVSFIDGVPLKSGYRRYKIKTATGGDDYACIREVVSRRFSRLAQQEEVFPDILLIDGGRGQLNAAVEAFTDLRIDPPLVLSLAKQDESVFVMGRPDPLNPSRHSAALRLLQYVRDEAHRFAQHYHHILRRKKTIGK